VQSFDRSGSIIHCFICMFAYLFVCLFFVFAYFLLLSFLFFLCSFWSFLFSGLHVKELMDLPLAISYRTYRPSSDAHHIRHLTISTFLHLSPALVTTSLSLLCSRTPSSHPWSATWSRLCAHTRSARSRTAFNRWRSAVCSTLHKA
jgi:hypothetical protein